MDTCCLFAVVNICLLIRSDRFAKRQAITNLFIIKSIYYGSEFKQRKDCGIPGTVICPHSAKSVGDVISWRRPGKIGRHEMCIRDRICIEGYLEVVLYAEASGQDETGGERKFVEVSRVTLCPREGKYGVQIPLGVWHSVDVKEPSTIFEAKDGAYVSASR